MTLRYTLLLFSVFGLLYCNLPRVEGPGSGSLQLNSITPDSAFAGDTVLLEGTGFPSSTSDITVVFGSDGFNPQEGTVLDINGSGTQMNVEVPANAEAGTVQIEVNGVTVNGPTFTALTCANLPTFTLPNDSIPTPSTVQFQAPIQDPSFSYSWDFGGGNTSTEINPSVSFSGLSTNTNQTIQLTLTKGSFECVQQAEITLVNGPLPNTSVLAFLDESNRLVFASPQTGEELLTTETLVIGNPIEKLAIDFQNRRLIISPGNFGSLLVGNLNGTGLTIIGSGYSADLAEIGVDEEDQRVYWVDEKAYFGNFELHSVRYNGTGKTVSSDWVEDAGFHSDMFIDKDRKEILLANSSDGQPYIRRSTLANPGTSLSNGLFLPFAGQNNFFSAMGYNPVEEIVYVYEGAFNEIRSYDLTAATPENTAQTIVTNPTSFTVDYIALDLEQDIIFWLDRDNGGEVVIEQASINGGSPSVFKTDVAQTFLKWGIVR